MMKYTPVSEIQPGQRFEYGGAQYVRATDDEIGKHPAKDLNGPRVLAYMLARGGNPKRTPTSFVYLNGDGPVMVRPL